MIERKPVLMAAVLIGLALAGCGDRTAASGGAGATGQASEEPIDAVPLPLDDNPLPPSQPAVVAPTTETKPAAAEEATATEPAAETATTGPAATLDPAAKPARVVVAPREPSRAVERPAERPAERPVERPAPPPAPEKDGDKPVLTF